MKRLVIIFTFLIVIYSAYYDLSSGTLPKAASNAPEKEDLKTEQQVSIPFQEVIIDNGQTVLSIVEHLHEEPVPASIQQIIYDFEELNPGVKSDTIQVGKSYLFPLYLKDEES